MIVLAQVTAMPEAVAAEILPELTIDATAPYHHPEIPTDHLGYSAERVILSRRLAPR